MRTNLKNTAIRVTVFAASLILTIGCNKSNVTPGNPAQSTGTYNMYMTDAPASIYQQVNVNITGAQVNSATKGWVDLGIHPGVYNLLTLTSGNSILLASGQVPTGVITQVRLILGSTDNTVEVNNTIYPLQTPSAEQSGLKINANAVMTAGGTYTLLLDFDAAMSVVQTGSGTYILKPVIRGVIAPFNGTIAGTVNANVTGIDVIAIANGTDSIGTVSSTASGNFSIQGLASGIYEVVVIPPPPYQVITYNNIQVSSGYTTQMGNVVIR